MKIFKLVSLFFLLAGCHCSNKTDNNAINITNNTKQNYDIEVYDFIIDNTTTSNFDNIEFRTIYNDDIYLNEMIFEEIYCYTNKLYKYDLIEKNIEEITSIKKDEANNRIYDIFELDQNNYLYIEITPNKIDGDFGIVYYAIYLQNNDNKMLITDGYVESIFKVPVFQTYNNKIFINSVSLKINGQNEIDFDNYIIKTFEIENDNVRKIEEFEQKNLNKLDLIISEDSNLKLLLNCKTELKERDIINKEEIIILEDEQNNFYKRAIPLSNGYFVSLTDWNDENYSSYFVIDNSKNKIDSLEYRFVDYIQLGSNTLAITNDGELFMLHFNGNNLAIERINKIPYAVYFRKIDNYSTLIFSSDKVYKFELRDFE